MMEYRYPRLIRSMILAACLSDNEAACSIRNWKTNRDIWSGEAVNHFGGFIELIKHARLSHSFRASKSLLETHKDRPS